MNKLFQSWIVRGLALLFAASAAFAQDRVPFRQEELDQMLAPIALYPDSLLSQILMAATYPLEVVQAARWSRANSQLQGEEAVTAVESMDWDPSVKSLVAFPQVLHRMDERLDWTQRLGEAFLAQEPHVLDAIQGLRQKAAAAGNLRSSDQMRVTRESDLINIEPANPRTVYVPYYDPGVVYGPWSWTGYPPIGWGPPVGYYAGYWPGFFWGPAIVVSTGFFFGHCNFHHRHVTVSHNHVVTLPRFGKPVTTVVPHGKPVAWQHNPVHRRGVPYRHASLQKEFGRSGMNRGDGRDHHRPDTAHGNHNRDGGRPGGFRDGRQDGVSGQNRIEGAPGRFSSQQGQGSRSTGPAAPTQQRRSDSGPDNSRFQGRNFAPQAAPAAPATRQAQRPDSNSNSNVRRFPSAPAAPAVRQDQRPLVAVPQRNAQPGAIRQQQPPAASHGDYRGQAVRQVMTPHRGAPAPAPQARVGNNPAPRMGNGGNSHSGGAGGGRGGSFR